jgi:hypothetical protein
LFGQSVANRQAVKVVGGEKLAFLFTTAANAKKVSYTYLNLTVAFR